MGWATGAIFNGATTNQSLPFLCGIGGFFIILNYYNIEHSLDVIVLDSLWWNPKLTSTSCFQLGRRTLPDL